VHAYIRGGLVYCKYHEALIALPGISVNSFKLTELYFSYSHFLKLAEQWLTATGALGRPAGPVVPTGFTRLWATDRYLVDHRDIDPRLGTIQTIDLPEMLEKGPGAGTGNRSTPDADPLSRNRPRENVPFSHPHLEGHTLPTKRGRWYACPDSWTRQLSVGCLATDPLRQPFRFQASEPSLTSSNRGEAAEGLLARRGGRIRRVRWQRGSSVWVADAGSVSAGRRARDVGVDDVPDPQNPHCRATGPWEGKPIRALPGSCRPRPSGPCRTLR
jgi:hypothetical protein